MLFRISLKRSFAKNDWKKRNLRRVTRSDKLKVAVLGRVPFRISLKNITGNACCKKKTYGSDKLKVAVVRRIPFRISLKEISLKYVLGKRCGTDKLKVAVVRRMPFRISLKEIKLKIHLGKTRESDKLKEERFETTGWK